ncbi:MAG: hypothetical protein CM15mP49_26200 [Actinomycetota bacterium]|nr:MAG: hypothetical protein CM15mP49_26200 [Actinomycetota bacterium]
MQAEVGWHAVMPFPEPGKNIFKFQPLGLERSCHCQGKHYSLFSSSPKMGFDRAIPQNYPQSASLNIFGKNWKKTSFNPSFIKIMNAGII